MKFTKSIIALTIALLPQFAFADLIEVFDCKGENKLALAKTQTGTPGNVVVNLSKDAMPGVVATLKGIETDITKSAVSVDGMIKFDDVQPGKYKLCSGTGMLTFRSINIAGTGVAAAGAGAGAGALGGTGGTLAVAGMGLGIAGVAIGTENSGSNPEQFDADGNPILRPTGKNPSPAS